MLGRLTEVIWTVLQILGGIVKFEVSPSRGNRDKDEATRLSCLMSQGRFTHVRWGVLVNSVP